MKVGGNSDEGFMEAVGRIRENLRAKNTEKALELDKKGTVLFVIDMLKGFVEKGALADPRIGGIVGPISHIVECLPHAPLVFMNDAHGNDSAEFGGYPIHCMKGTEEAEIVDGLRRHAGRGTILEKNSTNGFVSEAFQIWFEENKDKFSTYIVTGDCTDICIKQFALTLKAWFNERNRHVRIIVPMNAVETFDLKASGHDAELMNLISLYEMEQGGIEIVSAVD